MSMISKGDIQHFNFQEGISMEVFQNMLVSKYNWDTYFNKSRANEMNWNMVIDWDVAKEHLRWKCALGFWLLKESSVDDVIARLNLGLAGDLPLHRSKVSDLWNQNPNSNTQHIFKYTPRNGAFYIIWLPSLLKIYGGKLTPYSEHLQMHTQN